MDELLSHYTGEQVKVINEFWETIRWTRSTGRISDNVKKRELEYWNAFGTDIVIEALNIHIKNYPKIKEQYTRGIMKNLAYTKGTAGGGNNTDTGKPSPKKNRFANFTQRDWDYEAIAYIESLRTSGELTEAKVSELKKDKRYEKYFI